MKATIELERVNGERVRFAVPGHLVGEVADALCERRCYDQVVVTIREGKTTRRYALQWRERVNPFWNLLDAPPDVPTDHTRHSALALVGSGN